MGKKQFFKENCILQGFDYEISVIYFNELCILIEIVEPNTGYASLI